MATAIPAPLRSISPYLTRATELAKPEPAISYWCTYYALQQAIAIGSKDHDSTAYLLSLMDKLEGMKAQQDTNDAVTDDVVAAAYIENFALKIFVQADKEDRAGKASRLTAKKFLAAANFLELLSIFGEVPTESKHKIRYSKWKATDIAKAFREGRVPTPGPAGGLSSTEAEEEEGGGAEAEQVTGDEAIQLSKELAAMNAADEHSSAPSVSSIKADDDEEEEEEEGASLPSAPAFLPGTNRDDDRNETTKGVSTMTAATTDNQFLFPGGAVPTLPTTTIPTAPLLPSAPPHPHLSSTSEPSYVPGASPSALRPPPPLPTAPKPSSSAPPPPPSSSIPIYDPMSYASSSEPSASSTQTFDPSLVTKVQKHAKWAISALNYDDFDTARKELKAALALLGE